MAELWNSVTPPSHTETQVALAGLGKNAILRAGVFGAFLVVQGILPGDTVTVDLFDDATAPTHSSTKVALSGLSKDGILPAGDYGRYRIVSGHLPSAAGEIVTGQASSAGVATVTGVGNVEHTGNPAVSDGSSTVSAIGTVPPPAANPIRVTQVAREVLKLGDPNARLTQIAREILAEVSFGNPATSSGQATVTAVGFVAADEVRQTQEALEHVDFPPNDIRETQGVLENIQLPPPPPPFLTQAALEQLYGRPNETWTTQACLEVILPPSERQKRKNLLYTGLLARTEALGEITSPNDARATQMCLEVVIPASEWPS